MPSRSVQRCALKGLKFIAVPSGLADIPSKSFRSRTKLDGFKGTQTEGRKCDVFDIGPLASSVVISVKQYDSSHVRPEQGRKLHKVSRFQLQDLVIYYLQLTLMRCAMVVPNLSSWNMHDCVGVPSESQERRAMSK